MTAQPATMLGLTAPRIGPPRPDLTYGPAYAAAAQLGGLDLLPWQALALELAAGHDAAGRWLAREVAMIVARQNGKTTTIGARILGGLILHGHNVLHTAQNRALPRPVFNYVAGAVARLLPADRFTIRLTNGQEELTIGDPQPGTNYYPEGSYRILAPKPAAWRGYSADLAIFDEFREHTTWELVEAAKPTQAARPDPQVWYLSNAADITGAPLRELRERALSDDPGRLTWLEWSADDDYATDDHRGWAQANPALSRTLSVEFLADAHANMTEAAFRTEHLCQFVDAALQLAYPLDAWNAAGDPAAADAAPTDQIGYAIDVDPDRREAAAVAAWVADGHLTCAVVARWTGPLDDTVIAADAEQMRRRLGASTTCYDQATAAGVAEHLPETYRTRIGTTAMIAASASTYDAIAAGRLTHPADPHLDAAVKAAGRKPAGDGGWRITRRGDLPVPAAVALTMAIAEAVKPAAKPYIV